MPRGEIQVNLRVGRGAGAADAAERCGRHHAGGGDLEESAAAHATGSQEASHFVPLYDGSFRSPVVPSPPLTTVQSQASQLAHFFPIRKKST